MAFGRYPSDRWLPGADMEYAGEREDLGRANLRKRQGSVRSESTRTSLRGGSCRPEHQLDSQCESSHGETGPLASPTNRRRRGGFIKSSRGWTERPRCYGWEAGQLQKVTCPEIFSGGRRPQKNEIWSYFVSSKLKIIMNIVLLVMIEGTVHRLPVTSSRIMCC